jgi:uncharacterized damage-inducible protein DinB
MTEQVDRSELIARHEAVWEALASAFDGVDAAAAAHAPDGAWSAKDHLAHVVAWEHHRLAVLQGEDVPNAMGVSAETWATADEDALNALIADRTRDLPFEHVIGNLHATRSGLAAALRSIPDDRLTSRYRTLHPEDEERGDGPVGDWAIGLAEGHIGAHLGPIRARLAEARGERPPTVAGTLARIDAATDELVIAIAEYADHDAVGADGWRVADHAFHVAAWDRSCASLVSGSHRWERLRDRRTDLAFWRHRPDQRRDRGSEPAPPRIGGHVRRRGEPRLPPPSGGHARRRRPPSGLWRVPAGRATAGLRPRLRVDRGERVVHPGEHAASMRRIGTASA